MQKSSLSVYGLTNQRFNKPDRLVDRCFNGLAQAHDWVFLGAQGCRLTGNETKWTRLSTHGSDEPEHAHRAGEQQGKQEHLTGQEHSRQSLEHSRLLQTNLVREWHNCTAEVTLVREIHDNRKCDAGSTDCRDGTSVLRLSEDVLLFLKYRSAIGFFAAAFYSSGTEDFIGEVEAYGVPD